MIAIRIQEGILLNCAIEQKKHKSNSNKKNLRDKI